MLSHPLSSLTDLPDPVNGRENGGITASAQSSVANSAVGAPFMTGTNCVMAVSASIGDSQLADIMHKIGLPII